MSEKVKRPETICLRDKEWIDYADALETKIAALERRARIAERAVDMSIGQGWPIRSVIAKAEREIDAELAKEQAK